MDKKDKYYKEIEYKLYNYNMFKIGIENLKKEIEYLESDEVRSLNAITYDEERTGKTNKISNVIESTMLSISEKILFKEMNIKRLENKIQAIDRALEVLTDIEREVIKLRYIEGKQWYIVAYNVNYNERWCKELRKRAIDKLIIGIYGEEHF